MSPDNGAGMYPGRRSSPSLSTAAATAAVTPDGSRRSNSDGGGSASSRRRSLGEDGAGMEMVLSPVQSGLLEWLEGLAASSTREALQEQQQRRYSGTSSNGTTGGGLDGSISSGGSGGADPSATAQAGGGEGGGALLDGAAGGGGGGGDWSGVEVALRMLSAVTKAINLRDFCSPSPSSPAPALLGGAGTNGDAATAAAAAFRVYVPADGGVVGDGGRGTGATEALVEMLPSLPPGRRELQRSAAVLVGGLAAWLARRPRSLEPALQSVLGVLGLEEEGGGQAFMRDKGEDHVGAVALSKLVSAAGPSLAAVPSLPTHLLQRYLGLSAQLQSHRLLRPRPVAEGRRPPPGPPAPAAQPLPSEQLTVAGPAACRGTGSASFPWQAAGDDRPLSLEQQRGSAEAGGGGKAADAAAAARPPPLHAGSLRLFLGSICRMLGEAPRAGAVLEQQRGGGSGTGSTLEVEEVLRALVEGELRCLGSVLDRRRELAVVAAAAASPHAADEENRAMADVAKDSLSNLSLILGKTGPALDAPGLVAKLCGVGEGSSASAGACGGGGGGGGGAGEGGGRGVLVAMVAAYSLGEENILAHLCLLFEALVLSTSRRIRYFKGEALPRPGVNGNGGGVSSSTTSSHPIATVGRPEAGAAGGGGRLVEEGDNNAAAAAAAAAIGGLRVSTALGDALAEAFRRHPFHRFLVSLRCITAELPKLGRSFTSADPGVAAAPPDMSLRASEWVDQSLWAAAAGVAVGGSNGMVVGSGNEHNSNRSSTDSIGGGGAPPELVEALFKLMAEWVKELPVPSLRWLEAWLSVAVSGLAVRHRGPARAVLGLIQACCSQRKSPQFTATFSALLRGTALGVALTRGLLSGMCGAMPSWMLDDLVLTVRSLFDSLSPAAASSCVDAVLRDPSFERYSVTNEHKVAFSRKLKEDFCNKDWRAFKAGLKAFCGGKKKGTGGTPPVHASAAAAAAAAAAAGRQSAPQHPVPLNPLLAAGQHHRHHF